MNNHKQDTQKKRLAKQDWMGIKDSNSKVQGLGDTFLLARNRVYLNAIPERYSCRKHDKLNEINAFSYPLELISKFYQPKIAESSHYATDSTESSLSSTTSTTSTGTVVCNLNALKPKNNQTHSVSQMSLQSTGVTTAAFAKQSSPTVDKSNKCHLVQCTFKESGQKDHPTSKTTSSTSKNHGTMMFSKQKNELGDVLSQHCHNYVIFY